MMGSSHESIEEIGDILDGGCMHGWRVREEILKVIERLRMLVFHVAGA